MTALKSLSEGDYTAWQGLPAELTRADTDAALAPSSPPSEHDAALLGQPLRLRLYPPTAGAPLGLRMWFENGHALVLEVHSPTPRQALEAMLGEPEQRLDSLLGSTRDQWIYASRGLALHVSRITAEVFRLYGYRPCTVEQFLAAPLSQVALHRTPRFDPSA